MVPSYETIKCANISNKIEKADNRVNGFIPRKSFHKLESGDRFIPRRISLDVDAANFYINSKEETKDLLSQDPKEPTGLWYNRVGSLYPPSTYIYSFSNKQTKNGRKKTSKNEFNDPWPVCRSEFINRPGSLRPDHVYDLPNLRNNFFINTIDWSSSGFFAASLGSFVYTWNPYTYVRDTFAEFPDPDAATSLKWHPDGKHIAFGSRSGSIKVCDAVLKKSTVDGDCLCGKEGVPCCITSIAWHPLYAFHLAMGCTRGVVSALDVRNTSKGIIKIVAFNCVFPNYIASLRFSTSSTQIGKLLAVGGRSDYVHVLVWPTLTIHLKIQLSSPCRALAWHPWKPSLLAIGIGDGNGSIHVMNVMTEKLIKSYQPPVPSSACCLEWCPKSGLLICSYIVPPNSTKILILSSFDRVEQKVEGNFGRVLYLLWSPDGSQIELLPRYRISATAGSDETLRIWTLSQNLPSRSTDKRRLMANERFQAKEIATPFNFSRFIR